MPAEGIFSIQLGYKFAGPNNGTSNQLREKGYIKSKINYISYRFAFTPDKVYCVRDGLKGKKGNPDRQPDVPSGKIQ